MAYVWWVLPVGLVLTCSVMVQSQDIPHKSHLQYGMEKLHGSFFDRKAGGEGTYVEDSDRTLLGRCFICRKVVAAVEGIIEERIRKRTVSFCRNLVSPYQKKCFQTTKVYKNKLLNAIFPNGAWGTCKRMGHC